MMPSSELFGRVAAISTLLALCCLGAAPAVLPFALAGDVGQSFSLLTSTYYDTVDPQVLLSAASDALVEAARKHGVTIPPPALRVAGDRDSTLAQLDAAIVDAARAAHARAERFCLRGNQRDGQSDDRPLHAVLHSGAVQGVRRSA